LISLLVSCSDELATYEFESYNWKKNTPVDLSFDSDSEEKHDLVLEVRSIYDFSYPNLPLEFKLNQPDGSEITFSKELSFDKDELECSGDFCDQRIVICKDFKFSKGTYLIRIKPTNISVDLYGFIDFRLIQK
jgi:hypothetical protein